MDTLKQLFHQIDFFTWEEMPVKDPETEELTAAGWICRMEKYLKRAFFASSAMSLLQSVVRIVTSNDMMFKTWYPFNVFVSPAYELVMVSQMVAAVRFSIIFFAFPHVFAYIVCVACTQLDKVRSSLMSIKQNVLKLGSDSENCNYFNQNPDYCIHKELNHIVQHHQQVISYVRMLEDSMSLMMAGILFLSMFSLCASAFSAVMASNLGDITDMTQSVPAYLETVIFAFVYCGFGSLLSDKYESVGDAAWNSDWIGTPIPHQKSICFIIFMSRKGFQLTAGKVVPLSNITLMNCNDLQTYNINETLQRLTNTTVAAERATGTKWTWGRRGHVARLHQIRWTHAVTMWDSYVGKRGQGRPRLRWSDKFTKEAGKQWSRTAKNRVLWKELGKVIVNR
ncbi:hypothetical protein ANN_17324 [Periplaneta americana]|uniref:Odorant receptor n=1 Tax=Periplaneta americana TaxID=6978 RepID=A0ABQ8SSQ4_PERAM|nr:hypothetical protein ANN_17324 [Periplaneta americana]